MTKTKNQRQPFSPPGPNTPNHGMAHKTVKMPAVHPDQAKHIIGTKRIAKASQLPVAKTIGATVQGAPSIVEMTRALKNDPQLMFEFVYNNIEHKIGMGLAKGALGTLLDGVGNSFDLCSLLAALLREAGFEANYEIGQIQLTFTQAADWLGVTDTDIATVVTLLSNAGVPVSLVGTAPDQEILMTHCWLSVNIGDVVTPNWVVMDPSFKAYTTKAAIDLETATGYNASTFLSDARSGYTIDSSGNWVKDINRSNVRSSLTTLSMNLADWIRTNNPGAKTEDIVGGRTIVPISLPITFDTSLPYQASVDTPVEFTGDFSDAYKVSVRVVYYGIDHTFTSDQLCGHRLALYHVELTASQWTPVLFLDGYPLVTGTTPLGPASSGYLQVDVTHNAYPTTGSDQSVYLLVEGPSLAGSPYKVNYYLLGTSFGPTGKGQFDYFNNLQLQAESVYGTGPLVIHEPLLGARMAAQWASLASQQTMVTDLVNRMSGTHYSNHHVVGLVAYRVDFSPDVFSGFDIQGDIGSLSNIDGDDSNTAAVGILRGMHAYALEMLAIQQQTMPNEFANQSKAVSTTRLIDAASAEGSKIYKGTAANWTSDVAPNLTGYGSFIMNYLYTTYLVPGLQVLLPENYGTDFNVPYWTLRGWSIVNPAGGAGGTIFGAFAGGLGWGFWRAMPPTKCKDCVDDYVEPRTGDLNLTPPPDLDLGSGQEPLRLPFIRTYQVSERLNIGSLGSGWTHNWESKVEIGSSYTPYSNGFLALGSESPLSAVASIAEIFVTLDLLSDTSLPVDKLVIAHLCDQWWVDNLTSNIITVRVPGVEDLVFVKLPDGTYQAGRDNASTLTTIGASYVLTTPQQVSYTYSSSTDHKLQSITYPSGVTVSLSYSSGKLVSVDNGVGRTLTLSYTGDKLTSVSDGTGRSVDYGYTGDNLTEFTDALSQAHTYEYDVSNRLTQFFKPANPTDPVITVTYDSLSRVQSLLDILGHTKNYYVAGSRSEVVDPVGNSSISYYDSVDNPILNIDALGNVTRGEYDGLGRLVKKVMPEGNYTLWVYDASNNILTETEVAKPGSGLSNIVRSNTYDPLWNKVSTATDGRGNTTTYTYDGTTGDLLMIERPVINLQTPTVTMTWNGRGQVLTQTDETGIVTSFTYDTGTEVLLSTVKDYGSSPHLNLTTNFEYDTVGNVTSVEDPMGRVTSFVFDDLRRLTERTETAPFGYQTLFTYDGNSNLLSVARQTDILATPWQTYSFTYSLSDKKLTATDPASNVSLWTYDGADRLLTTQDAEGREYVYAYDELNRVQSVTDPDSVTSEIRVYSANGKLVSIGDARNYVTTFTFDGFDRPDQTIYPDLTSEQNAVYDENNNVLTFKTRSGDEIVRTYDVLNRIETKAPDAQPTVSYTYDLAGRLLTAEKPLVSGDPSTGVFEQQWDSAGRFFKEIYPDSKAVTFELDANSNVTKIVHPDGYYVDRAYDELNRLTSIKLNGDTADAVSFAYDALSRRTSMTYSSGATVTYEPQLNQDLTALTHDFVGSSLALTYGFNAVHQITEQNFSDDTYSWHPGAAGTVDYDPASDTNQYPVVGGVNFSYNANGCLTNDGNFDYAYDTENHLLSSMNVDVWQFYGYDPFHRQTERTVWIVDPIKTRYLYSGWQRIEDYSSDTGDLQNRYVYGTGLDEPLIQVSSTGDLTFLHANHQGSIIATSDDTGAVVDKNAYGPFGESVAHSGTTFGFTGQRFDAESGLYYYKRRYYSPAIGRFLQPDPIGYQIEAACGCTCSGGCGDDAKPSVLNLYNYVDNDPLNTVDPMGEVALALTAGQLAFLAFLLALAAYLEYLNKLKNAGMCPPLKLPHIEFTPPKIPPFAIPNLGTPPLVFPPITIPLVNYILKDKGRTKKGKEWKLKELADTLGITYEEASKQLHGKANKGGVDNNADVKIDPATGEIKSQNGETIGGISGD